MTASAPIYKSHKNMKLQKSWKRADFRLRSCTWMTSLDPGARYPLKYSRVNLKFAKLRRSITSQFSLKRAKMQTSRSEVPTLSLKGDLTRPTILLESWKQKKLTLTQVNARICFMRKEFCYTNYQRLLRAAQRVLWSPMRLSEPRMRNTGLDRFLSAP